MSEAYCPPISLWKLLEDYTSEHEHEEIKVMLGKSFVEQSLELQQEVTMLLEIWRDYREETANSDDPVQNVLPEPPEARERLCREIQFFVECIREKSQYSGRDPDHVLLQFKSDVINYACDKRPDSGCGTSRPSTARSKDGRETPWRQDTPTSDRYSHATGDELESLNSKLNVLEFDEVVESLRSKLVAEVEQLSKDLIFLQKCLDDEADFRSESRASTVEPSLSDLREERNLLEKEMLITDPVPEPIRTPPGNIIPRKIGAGLRPLAPTPPRAAASGPLRANHHISAPNSSTALRAIRQKHMQFDTAHVTVRTSPSPPPDVQQPQSAPQPPAEAAVVQLMPVPPQTVRTTERRPGSANRFRQMVMECRDT